MFDLSLRARPIVKWAGGKSQLLPELLGLFPAKFDRYVEPLLGGGALFLALPTKCPAIINDSNDDLMAVYRIVRDEPESLMRELDRMEKKYGEEFYYTVRDEKPRTDLKRAARLVFLNKTCFNGLYRENAKGRFNVPFGKKSTCPELYDRENILAVSERLRPAKILCLDFEAVIDGTGTGDFVYCDPPYVPRSLTSSFNAYTGNGFALEDHQRLAAACQRAAERGAVVAISNSGTDLSQSLYAGWRVEDVWAKRTINSKPERRGEIRELVALLAP